MGGSGATLGAAKAVSLLKPEGVEVGCGGRPPCVGGAAHSRALPAACPSAWQPCMRWQVTCDWGWQLKAPTPPPPPPGSLACVAVQVHFIVAACENMVDGRGLRPGDILVAANGKVGDGARGKGPPAGRVHAHVVGTSAGACLLGMVRCAVDGHARATACCSAGFDRLDSCVGRQFRAQSCCAHLCRFVLPAPCPPRRADCGGEQHRRRGPPDAGGCDAVCAEPVRRG